MNRKPKPKAIWTKCFPEQRQKANGRHTKAQLKKYREFKEIMRGALCLFPKCTRHDTEPHHMRGRTGNLIHDWRFIAPLCPKHHDWVHQNIEKARQYGLICEKGLWGKQP